jgi:hypothetical protein
MKTFALFVALLIGSPAAAHDALLRASNLANAKSFLAFLGYADQTLSTPYAQGKMGGVTYFLVFAGAGNGVLYTSPGVPYDAGLWGYIRYQGDLGTFHLPAGTVAVMVDGKAVVASGGDGLTTITDTFNATPQTPTQPPATAIATATGIM